MIAATLEAGFMAVERATSMPRYYIDTSDQERFVRDHEGFEFEDINAAKNAAVDALPEMARDQLPNGDSRTFTAVVRDRHGRTLVQATMSFGVTWMTNQR